jgi:hypothetical protein
MPHHLLTNPANRRPESGYIGQVLRYVPIFVLALLAAPCAAQEQFSLYCGGRGTPDYPDAELRLSASGNHVVDVVFVGFRPSRGRADWSLRDCLNTAARYAGERDIVASLWYRERDDRRHREPMAPYGAVYKASSRTIVVQHKVAAN